MHEFKSNLVFGFHGCEAAVRDELIFHPERIKISEKPFDWLGHGLYFWEGSVDKAWQWAKEKKARGEIQEPAVIGALLQLGNCCDLVDSLYIDMLSNFHQLMVDDYRSSNHPLPENKDAIWDLNKDKLLRYLDCAVIEYMHLKLNQTSIIQPQLKPFDSIRGSFLKAALHLKDLVFIPKLISRSASAIPIASKAFLNPGRKSIATNG